MTENSTLAPLQTFAQRFRQDHNLKVFAADAKKHPIINSWTGYRNREQTAHLSVDARRWWRKLIEEYDIDDPAGLLLLQTGMEAFDRMIAAAAEIAIEAQRLLGAVVGRWR
jgi:hypothetical protein